MKVATKANVHTANATHGLNPALNVAAAAPVMGMGVVGLGVLGLSLLYIFYSGQGWELEKPSACLRASVLARPPSPLRVWVVASTTKAADGRRSGGQGGGGHPGGSSEPGDHRR